MKWSIPAKTFLVGEYAALAEASAIILTTTPCFELTLTLHDKLSGIHSESPAGIWWQQKKHLDKGLFWYDPYECRGGLGASSAQFLSSYLASCFLTNKAPHLDALLCAYYESSWAGKGLRPSGYDVIAQSQKGCVYINKRNKIIESYSWPFQDLSFFLIHTQVKLATHHHLQDTSLPDQIEHLSSLVDEAKLAFVQADSKKLITVVNDYHKKLEDLNLIAKHSLNFINQLKKHSEIRAIKGCGALGADVLLIITMNSEAEKLADKLKRQNWIILATEKNIYLQEQLINNSYPL